MKSPLFQILLATFLMVALSVGNAENFIRQTQLDTGLQYDYVTASDSGSSTSLLPVVEGGVSYELYARGSAWDDKLYFLDRKVVGVYLPKGNIEVFTEDNSELAQNMGIPRTRADRPYSVAISVAGLIPTDPKAPLSAKQVLYTHIGQNYDDTYTPNGNTEYILASYYMGNSTPSLTPLYTQLTPMAPTKAMGVEKFILSTLTDETIKQSSILDEAMVVVWPVSEVRIEGLAANMEIKDNLPKLVVNYIDLYPASFTYMQIYKGAEALGTVGTPIGSSMRWHNTIVPQNETITFENWDDLIPDDGTYTIEVLSTTPFDNWAPERLAHITFNVNRKIEVNAQTTTSEE